FSVGVAIMGNRLDTGEGNGAHSESIDGDEGGQGEDAGTAFRWRWLISSDCAGRIEAIHFPLRCEWALAGHGARSDTHTQFGASPSARQRRAIAPLGWS